MNSDLRNRAFQNSLRIYNAMYPNDEELNSRTFLRILNYQLSSNSLIDGFIDYTIERYMRELTERLINFINQISTSQNNPISENQLNDLNIVTFNTIENPINTTCNICLEDFEEISQVIKLKCNHIYHDNCIKHWLGNYNNNCPVCKEEI